jgi:hypothetical protein
MGYTLCSFQYASNPFTLCDYGFRDDGFAASRNSQTSQPRKREKQYTAPDGSARAVVVPVGKEAGRSEYESRIEFQSNDFASAHA